MKQRDKRSSREYMGLPQKIATDASLEPKGSPDKFKTGKGIKHHFKVYYLVCNRSLVRDSVTARPFTALDTRSLSCPAV